MQDFGIVKFKKKSTQEDKKDAYLTVSTKALFEVGHATAEWTIES